jgi:hypothetical protein
MMINCIICGKKTKDCLFDYCEECFMMSIEEIEKRYPTRRASETSEDHLETPGREDFYKSPKP